MPRQLHTDTKAEIAKNYTYEVVFVELRLDSGIERYNTSHNDIVFNGNTYVSSPNLIDYGDITESQSIEISSMNITLSGVNLGNISNALSQNVIDRRVIVHKGFLDTDTFQLINDPIVIYVGRIRSFSIAESPDNTASLVYSTGSVLADFSRTAGRRTNTQDQKVYLSYIGDTGQDLGFEFAHQIQYDLAWGRK